MESYNLSDREERNAFFKKMIYSLTHADTGGVKEPEVQSFIKLPAFITELEDENKELCEEIARLKGRIGANYQ